ncbi:MAG: hypothetical protein WCA97_09095 [Terriglobales bacterium]
MKANFVLVTFCWMMIALVPVSLLAAGAGVGMLHPYGTAWLNGAAVSKSSTVFPGDLVQTNSGSALNIRSAGSSVTVLSDSLVKFEGDAVSVEHGTVKLATSKSMFAHAGMVTAAPASAAWTEFEFTEANGTVQIVALKGDLKISNGSQSTILSQGQQATQKDSNPAHDTRGTMEQAGFVLAAAAPGSLEAATRDPQTAAAVTSGVQANTAVKVISPKLP